MGSEMQLSLTGGIRAMAGSCEDRGGLFSLSAYRKRKKKSPTVCPGPFSVLTGPHGFAFMLSLQHSPRHLNPLLSASSCWFVLLLKFPS